MKKIIVCFTIISCLFGNTTAAQYLKLDNGMLSTAYRNEYNREIADIPAYTYVVNAGIDYLDCKWFYLSSQIGYTRIGGIQKAEPLPGVPWTGLTFPAERKSYVHLNTTFRGQKKYQNGLALFVGLGPYLNLRAGSNEFSNEILKYHYKLTSYYGGKGEIGFTLDIQKVRFGLSAFHLRSLSPAAKGLEWVLELSNHNWGASASVGYRIFD